jgi:hypothetical protein
MQITLTRREAFVVLALTRAFLKRGVGTKGVSGKDEYMEDFISLDKKLTEANNNLMEQIYPDDTEGETNEAVHRRRRKAP